LTNRAFERQLGGDLRGALADYSDSIAANPRHAEAFYDRGTVRQALGDPAGAIADYTEAMRLDPGDARAYNNRGWVRETMGDLAGAVADYTSALPLTSPGTPQRAMVERNLASARGRVERR
jgi:tetratricopeptide (TPR) repeat protein